VYEAWPHLLYPGDRAKTLPFGIAGSLVHEGYMSVLQELLGSMPVSEFLQGTFSRLPFAMPDRARR
jgi:hypothetical protein